jgi:hypothetical protein
MGRRGLIRIAHPKIDDVLATVPSLEFESLDLRKHIRWKPFEAIKFLHDSSISRIDYHWAIIIT